MSKYSYTIEAGKAAIEGFDSHYRSGSSDLARDFFIPCLEHCSTYKRAVGYFSSSALVTWAEVLPRIAKLDTIKIQLLISPLLSEQDKEAQMNGKLFYKRLLTKSFSTRFLLQNPLKIYN